MGECGCEVENKFFKVEDNTLILEKNKYCEKIQNKTRKEDN